ncbi:hypothetical protein BRPE64_ACDS23640 [Caballeronia insecticola]|uniref:Uncharacterized protein n=1 Tax=Caballeronia insecticola TaxID=758793 RepID=R4WIE0_9BURK|nr:hypothetical protein BRPE64_ACDS23640 [Caballeronia insecticola]
MHSCVAPRGRSNAENRKRRLRTNPCRKAPGGAYCNRARQAL